MIDYLCDIAGELTRDYLCDIAGELTRDYHVITGVTLQVS